MNNSLFKFIAVCTVFIVFKIVFEREYQKKSYNNGKCRKCNGNLKLFKKDKYGYRGYKCDKCHYVIWCSYNVDDYKDECV